MNTISFSKTSLLAGIMIMFQCPIYGQIDTALTEDINRVVQAYSDAREASNPEEIRQLLTDDADQLVSSGQWRRGKETLVEGMLQSSQSNPGQRTLTVETVRLISIDVAITDARYDIKRTDGTERNMWSTFILRKEANQWKIAAIRNMMPAQ